MRSYRMDASGKIAVAMTALYALNGATQFISSSFVTIYLSGYEFVDTLVLGAIVALWSLVTAVAQPVWGIIADHAHSKNKVLAVVIISVAALIWLFIVPEYTSLATLLPAIVALYFVVYVPQMLIDTIVVENMDKVRLRFGIIRAFASGGAAFSSFLLFVLSQFMDVKPQTAFIMLSAASILALIPLRFLPLTRGHASERKEQAQAGGNAPGKFDFKSIVRNRRFMLLMAFGLCHFVFVNCHNTFFAVYYTTERGLNAGVGIYGLFYAVSIAAEVVVMTAGFRPFSKLNVYTVFSIVPAAAFARSLIVYFAPNPYIMFFCSIFHGLMFGLLWMRVAVYIGSIVPDEMRATGQACWSVMVMGLGPVIGSLLGGVISDRFGIRGLFLFIAGALFVVSCVFFFLFRKQGEIDRAEGFVAE